MSYEEHAKHLLRQVNARKIQPRRPIDGCKASVHVRDSDAIRFWTKWGRPVMEEFHHGRRQRRLTFPTRDGRSYYRVGDFILHGRFTREKLERMFPELKGGKSGPSVLKLLANFILQSEPKEYLMAWRIESILPQIRNEYRGAVKIRGPGKYYDPSRFLGRDLGGRGGGMMKCRACIFFDGKSAVALESRQAMREYSWSYWNNDFIMARHKDDMEFLAKLVRFTGEFVGMAVGSYRKGITFVSRKAAQEVAKEGTKKLVKRILSAVLKTLWLGVKSGGVAFVKTAVEETQKYLEEQEIRDKIAKGKAAKVNWNNVIEKASFAFASELVNVGWNKLSAKLKTQMDEAMQLEEVIQHDNVYMHSPNTIKTRLTKAIALEISKLGVNLLADYAQAVVSAATTAMEKTPTNKDGKFNEAVFLRELSKGMETGFLGRLKAMLADPFKGSIADGVLSGK